MHIDENHTQSHPDTRSKTAKYISKVIINLSNDDWAYPTRIKYEPQHHGEKTEIVGVHAMQQR